jgi:gamma-glutamylcyclotransferase
MKQVDKYFAYGSNTDITEFEKNYKSAKAMDLGWVDGYKLVFDKIAERDKNSPVADIIKSPGDVVFGILYSIDREELPKLDKQEGGYQKIQIKVHSKDGRIHNATTYTVIDKQDLPNPNPKLYYIRKMLVGLNDALKLGIGKESKEVKTKLIKYAEHIKDLYKKSK